MAPQAFLEMSLDRIKEHGSDYRAVAGTTVSDPNGYQAILYHGHNNTTFKRDFVLHVADTDPEKGIYEEAAVSVGQIDPGEGRITVDGLVLMFFVGVGSLTLQEPFHSV